MSHYKYFYTNKLRYHRLSLIVSTCNGFKMILLCRLTMNYSKWLICLLIFNLSHCLITIIIKKQSVKKISWPAINCELSAWAIIKIFSGWRSTRFCSRASTSSKRSRPTSGYWFKIDLLIEFIIYIKKLLTIIIPLNFGS